MEPQQRQSSESWHARTGSPNRRYSRSRPAFALVYLSGTPCAERFLPTYWRRTHAAALKGALCMRRAPHPAEPAHRSQLAGLARVICLSVRHCRGSRPGKDSPGRETVLAANPMQIAARVSVFAVSRSTESCVESSCKAPVAEIFEGISRMGRAAASFGP